MNFNPISYNDLNARQQEAYNFQKVSAILADYGFITIKLSNDWNGADFIAQNYNSSEFLKVQLKGPMTFDKKYIGKNISLCFKSELNFYLADHDTLMEEINQISNFKNTESWLKGTYAFPRVSKDQKEIIKKYMLTEVHYPIKVSN